MDKALMIVGHGSKSKEAVDIFIKTVELVKKNSDYAVVKGAHMELAQPNIEDTVADIALKSPGEIIIVPYFLYPGNHIKFDIPEIIAKLAEKYPEIKFRFGKPIGFEPAIADIILKRAKEAENI